MGLTGLIYGVAAAILNTVFVVLAAAVFANKAEDVSEMKPERRLFAFSILYLFGLFAALVVDRWVVAMNPHPEDELLRRQRERARLMAWLLGAFVVLLFLITIAKIGLNK